MLELAIDHPDFAARIREHRVRTPAECTTLARVGHLKDILEAAGELTAKNKLALEAAMDDPEQLAKLEAAWLSDEDRIRFGAWLEEGDFRISEEASAIRDFLVRTYRKDLRGFRIPCVFQQSIPPVLRRGRLGTATKLPGKMRFLTEYDALITLDFGHWCRLTDRDRQRLVHHELMHLDVDGGALRLRDHDFEDFAVIMQVYGLRSESERFNTDGPVADILEHVASQLELLGRTG